jgi:hypothetical protein
MERLKRRGAVEDSQHTHHLHYIFNPAELAMELDRLIAEARVRPFLHTRFVGASVEDGRVEAAIVEDKTGRRAIRAAMFIDASGDADLAHRAGLPCFVQPHLQPPTTCGIFAGLENLGDDPSRAVRKVVFDPAHPQALRRGFLWGAWLPGRRLYMIAGTRIHGANGADAEQLTAAEIEGRRQLRAMLDMIRQHVPGGGDVQLAAIPARIGIRHSRQARCLHKLTEQEVLRGVRFDDAIANGSYRVDVHAAQGDGLVFRYLDGREETVLADGTHRHGRWRDAGGDEPTFYQVPYRCLVPQGARNVLVAGRCIDADEGAYGAIRVMINCNQLGEAAGVAAHLALNSGVDVPAVDPAALRRALERSGAVVI